jgi:hypothetical protein
MTPGVLISLAALLVSGGMVRPQEKELPPWLTLSDDPVIWKMAVAWAKTLADDERSDAEVTEAVFKAMLARKPTDQEMTQVTKYLKDATNRETGLAGVIWALATSREFRRAAGPPK